MKRQKTLEKAQRSHSGIDFESCAQTILTSDGRKKLEYSQLKATSKYAIKNAFMDDVDTLLHKYTIGEDSDRIEVLRYVEKHLVKTSGTQTTTAQQNNDALITSVLNKLKLPERNQLIRLLTHSDNELNTDVLAVYPALRARSEILLRAGKRKARSDKIDLQFISDFMHRHCRYESVLYVDCSSSDII